MMIKRLLLAALVSTPCLAGQPYYLGATSAPASGSTFADVIFWLNFENNTNANPYVMANAGAAKECSGTASCSAGDTQGSFLDDFSNTDPGVYVVGTAAKIGSYGLVSRGGAANSEYIDFSVSSNDIISPAEGSLGTWIQYSTVGTQYFFRTVGGTLVGCYSISSSSPLNVQCDYGAVSVFTTGGVMSTGNWYYFEFDWNDSTDTLSLKITDSGGSTVQTKTACPAACDQTIASFSAATGWTDIRFGTIGNSAAQEVWLDNIAISNLASRDLTAERNDTGSPR